MIATCYLNVFSCQELPGWREQQREDRGLRAGAADQGGRVRGEGGGEVPHQVDRARGR